jgi:ABC-type transport system involved in cytochrome c biogenesis ATPase subunit
VSFSLDFGQSLLISGANGIGKTTLLESIAGLRTIADGELFYQNHDLLKNKDKWFDDSFYRAQIPI